MVRLPPHTKTASKPCTVDNEKRFDAEKVITNKAAHGVKRDGASAKPVDNLQGSGARVPSGSADQHKGSERQHFSSKQAVRFSQGHVTTAAVDQNKQQNRGRMDTVAVVVPDKVRPHTASANARPAKGAVPQADESATPRPHGKAKCDPFRGETLVGTSLMQHRGSCHLLHRSRSLEAARRDAEESCRPKAGRQGASEKWMMKMLTLPPRSNDNRYQADAGPAKVRRTYHALSARQAVTPPWVAE